MGVTIHPSSIIERGAELADREQPAVAQQPFDLEIGTRHIVGQRNDTRRRGVSDAIDRNVSEESVLSGSIRRTFAGTGPSRSSIESAAPLSSRSSSGGRCLTTHPPSPSRSG